MRVSKSLLTSGHDPLHEDQPNYSSCASIPKSWIKWFCIMLKPVTFVQDTTDLSVKLKSLLLNPNVVLKMGPTCEAGAYHLQIFAQNLARKSTFYGKKIYKPQRSTKL